jgi:hypothetical protein
MSLRQESLGREEEPRTQKPFIESLRVQIPPGKAGPAARNESCVVVGRPTLRSVDSEVKGRVIEPRKLKTLGAFVVDISGGRVRRCCTWTRRTRLILPGSKNTGNDHQGFPGTWETRWSPPTFPARDPEYQLPGAHGRASRPLGANRTQGWYRQAITKPGERDGRESERPILAWKRGNGPSRTPWSEGGAALWTRDRNHVEGIEPPSVSPTGRWIV